MNQRRRIKKTGDTDGKRTEGRRTEGRRTKFRSNESGRMDRMQFYLEPSLNRELDRLSAECNVSKAELIRDGVRHIVEEYQAVEDDPLFDIVGAGEGEITDGSEEHDKYL